MNDSDESDDDFFDAQQDNTQQRSIEQRVSRLEEQIDALSGQMSTILERLDTIVAASQSQPSESSRRPMRACHARKSRPPQTTTDHAASKAGRKPIPDSETESEAVDRDDNIASTASLLSGVMKNFPTIPLTDPKSRRGKPHVPPITIPVYNGVGHVDDWIELVLADAVAGHWTEATCRNVWMRYLGASVKDYLRTFPAERKKTFKDVCGLLMKRYGAYRGKDALRRKFEVLKQDKGRNLKITLIGW